MTTTPAAAAREAGKPEALPRVGWIGLGNIGAPMALRVAAAGFPLQAWARHPEQAAALAAAGATLATDPESLAQRCDLVATIVGGPQDVSELHRRMIPVARRGTLFVDMTTAAAANADEARVLAASVGANVLDAPVTGGVGGAQRGALTAFVGGDAGALERARPLLAAFCARVVHAGPPGAGYRMKLVNQTMIAGTLLGLAGGARLARACGFASPALKDALSGGTAAGFLFDSYVARMIDGDGPVTFTLGMLRKDLRLARDEVAACGLDTGFHDAALAAVEAACVRHGEREGVQALAAAG